MSADPARPTGGGRLAALDGLRAVAIGMVVAQHAVGWKPGTLGVDVFFVLSGFLITSLLLTEFDRRSSVSFRGFYLRRALRLMPAYVVMLAATTAFALTLGEDRSPGLVPRGLLHSLTYTTNVANGFGRWDAEVPRLWEMTWSLAAEEQFYLVWPVVLLVGLRFARTERARLALGWVPLAGFAAAWLWSLHLVGASAFVLRIANGPDTRSPMILLGCTLALWRPLLGRTDLPGRALAWTARAGGLGVAGWALWSYDPDDQFAQARLSPVLAVATALLVVGLIRAGSPRTGRDRIRRGAVARVLGSAPMAWLGRISYSLYLYNVLAVGLVDVVVGDDTAHWWVPAASVAVALALAAASHRYVEQPFLRRRGPAPGTGAYPPEPPWPDRARREPPRSSGRRMPDVVRLASGVRGSAPEA